MRNDTLIIVSSYERKEMLLSLLNKLGKQISIKDILIFDDQSSFKMPKEYLFLKLNEHYGKEFLWKKFRFIFEVIPKSYKYYIFLPDDVEIEYDFVEKSIEAWKSINDKRKICLSLLTDNRTTYPNWTGVLPIVNCSTILTQWNDLCFICEAKFFDNVNIQPIKLKRFENPNISSGVGEQISIQLFKKQLNQYHVKETLVHHGNHDSKMHYEHRKKTPIIC